MSTIHEGPSVPWWLHLPWMPMPETPSELARAHPVCYQVVCAPGDATTYTVMIADWSGRGTMELGTCTHAGQVLSGAGLQGSVECAAPAQVCNVQPAVHTSAGAHRKAKGSQHLHI
mmetsp:Transcript_41891/g.133090  ORF Transcript_41891/g.133090 Transcript_41891/m.133090 type:complete len:116 (-) Transcript_41891:34-381(-)